MADMPATPTSPASAPNSSPVTVTVTRRMTVENPAQVMAWFQAGTTLAEAFDGFLGSGWVRSSQDEREWHVLYRFRDHHSLDAWQDSTERRWWLDAGGDMVEHVSGERRVGIEGWFDEPEATAGLHDTEQFVPPRWKQMVTIFTGFFPMSLLVQYILTHLLPADTPLVLRVLASIAIVMPPMVYFVLPFVTKLYQPWLEKGKR